MGEETADEIVKLLKSTFFISNILFFQGQGVDLSDLPNKGQSRTKELKLIGSFEKNPELLIVDRKNYLEHYKNKLL